MASLTFFRAAGLALALGVTAAVAVAPRPASALDAAQRKEFETVIRDYLMKNPEVIQEAIGELQKRQETAEADKRKKGLLAVKPTVFDSPRGIVVGNPKGDVTLVEFFDYNCGYCRHALADLNELVAKDPNLKVVLKEFPVLGPGSVEAAQVAVAVRLVAPDKYLAFHEKLLGGRGQASKATALAAAVDVGIDKAMLNKALADPEITASIEESMYLGDTLGINGTPSYVLGNDVVVGAVGADRLKGAIDSVRKCGEVTC